MQRRLELARVPHLRSRGRCAQAQLCMSGNLTWQEHVRVRRHALCSANQRPHTLSGWAFPTDCRCCGHHAGRHQRKQRRPSAAATQHLALQRSAHRGAAAQARTQCAVSRARRSRTLSVSSSQRDSSVKPPREKVRQVTALPRACAPLASCARPALTSAPRVQVRGSMAAAGAPPGSHEQAAAAAALSGPGRVCRHGPARRRPITTYACSLACRGRKVKTVTTHHRLLGAGESHMRVPHSGPSLTQAAGFGGPEQRATGARPAAAGHILPVLLHHHLRLGRQHLPDRRRRAKLACARRRQKVWRTACGWKYHTMQQTPNHTRQGEVPIDMRFSMCCLPALR